jgi:beta-lactam-binding protein with PASTA domain
VPDLKGKTEQEVKDILRSSELNLGTISQQESSKDEEINKVVSQSSPAGTKKPKASSVDITIAIKK